MNKKEIIILAAIGAGVYILSQVKAMKTYIAPQYAKTAAEKVAEKVAEKIPDAATPAARKKIAEKIAARKRIAEKIAARKRIAEKIAARKRIAEKIAARKRIAEKIAFTPKIKLSISILSVPEKIQALVAYRKKIAAEKKVSPQSISLTPDQRARVLLEAAIKKAAQKIKARRAEMARYAKRQRPQIERPNPNKRQASSKLFPGAEKSRIIPYSESSKHSYYGPKSHKVLNPGYMEKRYKADYNTIEAYDARKLQELLQNRKPWQR